MSDINPVAPINNKLIPANTPVHVYHTVLALIKDFFTTQTDPYFPWKYDNDVEKTKVIIDTAFNKESNLSGNKPIIIVNRGDAGYGNVGMGDKTFISSKTSYSNNTATIQSSVTINVVGRTQGEVDIISNELFMFLLALRPFLPAILRVLNVQSINMTQISNYEEYDNMYNVTIMISYLSQVMWDAEFTANLLNSIGVHMNIETHLYRLLDINNA